VSARVPVFVFCAPTPVRVLLLLTALCACSDRSAEGDARSTSPSTRPDFVGSDACSACHAAEHGAWARSHHASAMQPAGPTTVLAAFDGRGLTHRVEHVRPVRDGDAFFFEITGSDGAAARHPVRYTFGVAPLQQYLVETERGRLQAFTWCWDTRPAAAGGQRWFYLYPDDTDAPGTPRHWSGPSQNWNHQCAECHATDVEKRYDATRDAFETRMAEARVGCEACHGPGSAHLEWAQAPAVDAASAGTKGLQVPLRAADRATFTFRGDDPIARAIDDSSGAAVPSEVESCGQCHARRGSLLARHAWGRPLADTHRVALLEPPLYFADGQMRDEVFNYGSFVQSRMYAAGVSCGHCHEPHGGKLRADGNAVCAQCHAADTYDRASHHGHPATSRASQCVTCHMPARTFMVVDERHDHGFHRPDPLQSAAVGSPDVCTGCHANREARWAEAAIRSRRRAEARARPDFARALSAAARWSETAPRALLLVADDPEQPPIVRATALQLLAPWASAAVVPRLRRAAGDVDPLVRAAAATWSEAFPPEIRSQAIGPSLQDAVLSVRLAAAQALVSAGRPASPRSEPDGLSAALAEYRASLAIDADRTEGLVGLGLLAAWEGDADTAVRQLRAALARDAYSELAAANLADVLRATGDDTSAERVLRESLERVPDSAALQHVLGLLLARTQRGREAIEVLGEAARLAPDDPRLAYVHGVALHDLDSPEAGIAALERALERAPGYSPHLEALMNWHAARGDVAEAGAYRERLEALWSQLRESPTPTTIE
jgi:predicted CXXCH cytochrome family protein